MGSGRVKTTFNMVSTLARVSVRSKKQRRDNGKQAGTRTNKMSKPAHDTCLPKHQNSQAAPLQPIPVEPAACSQPSRAKIWKHGWSTGSPKMEPAKIEPRGGDTGVLKASGGLLGARFAPGGRKGEKKIQHCPNMDFPKLPGRSWAGLGRPPKSNPAGAKIEPREGQNGVREASGRRSGSVREEPRGTQQTPKAGQVGPNRIPDPSEIEPGSFRNKF